MTPERWRQISDIFHAAKQRDGDEQATFVASACGDDHLLHEEVRWLLQAHHDGEGFGSSPVMLVSAQLVSGRLFGPYQIENRLGAGGMGDVYRARDTNLNRAVALKVLPEAFALDADRLARFKREAQVLASLNHPNIAAIYGLETSDGIQALVLELIEGPTLADRIAQGPIPPDEVLPIARQIAEALEAAHEQGIIHRDLKPANIKVRPDGTVKVLDFGLAKWLDPGMPSGDIASSPTITAPAMPTGLGVIVGTPAYMSPEQASGKNLDKRTDIWAFACVLYEMLTARHAFGGDEVTATLGSVLTKEPDWNALPSGTPVAVRRLLSQCLQKDPRRRTHDIGDARLEIERLLGGAPVDEAASIAPLRPVWRQALPWGFASVLGVALALVLVRGSPWRAAAPLASVRLEATIGADASLVPGSASLAVSPDGSFLAFAAQNSQGTQQLYVRRLGELRAGALPDTLNARNPFFSPDGQWVAFFANGQLKKVAVSGGTVVTLCAAPNDRGGAWAGDGSIVFQPAATGGLLRVSSSGGAPAPLTTLGEGEATHRWPQVLLGSAAVLYTAHYTTSDFDNATLVVQPLSGGAATVVHRGGYYGRYLPSGHLLYIREGTLFAERFDLARLEPTGPPAPVVEGISAFPGSGSGAPIGGGSAQVAWTEGGTAVYVAGQPAADEAPMQWMDRTGQVSSLRSVASSWSNPSVAPDGQRLAVDMGPGPTDVWAYEWASDRLTRMTADAAADQKPVWTPDGQRIVFRSNRDKSLNLYWLRADGTGEVQRLTESPNSQNPSSWHPSGKFLAFHETRPKTDNDLMILPIEGDEASGWKPGEPTVFLGTPFNESEPMFSPDGRWIAYSSTESGPIEIYVRPFPGPGGKWKISTDGGFFAAWSRTHPEIFYLSLDSRLMVASYTVQGDSFNADKPRVWSDRRIMLRPRLRSFALHPDGERVVVAAAPDTESAVKQDKLVLIFNFFDELRRLSSPR